MGGVQQSDSELVLAARGDDGEAFGELFNRWFNSSWNVARTIVRQDDLAADVAQDALLTAWQRLDQLDDPDAFGGWLLRITRNRALNRLQREQRSKATGDDVVSGLRDKGLPDPTGAERQLEPDSISEVRDRQELVWAASAALGERDASLLDLHLRHGLSPAEIADELGVEANNAHQQLYRLRTKLGDAIGSYLLWRNGRPLCDGLAQAVSGDVAFDRSVARAVTKHQASCEYCSERRSSLVDPSKLFAAAPLVLVPSQLKVQAAAALQSSGVPLGSNAGGGSAGDGGSGTGGGGSSASGSGSGSSSAGSSAPGGAPGTPVGAPVGGSPGGVLEGLGASAPGAPLPGPVPAMSQGSAYAVSQNSGPKIGFFAELLDRTSNKMLFVGAGAVATVVAIALFLTFDGSGGDSLAAIGSETDIADEPSGESGPSEAAGDDQSGGRDELAPAAPSSADDSDEADSTSQVEETPPQEETTAPETTESPTPTEEEDSTTEPETTEPDTTETTRTTVTSPPSVETTEPPRRTTSSSTTTSTEPDPVTTPPDITTSSVVTVPPTPPPPPPPPPPQPGILRFIGRRVGGNLLCQDRTQAPFQAAWETEFTDSVSLDHPNGVHAGGPSGSFQFCGSRGDVIILLAIGPGGESKSTVVLS